MNRTLQIQAAQSTSYTYNNIYELTSVSGAQTHSYSYDKVGNRNVADGVAYSAANNLNQYTARGSTVFSYDTNGNLTNDGTNIYVYDEENRLTSLSNTTNSATYKYDAFNHRISKTVNGTITYFVNDGDRVVEDRNTSGGLIADYVYGTGIDEVLTMTRGGSTYYYHYDGLGSVSEITNALGTVVENYTYDVYGQPSVTTSAIGNRFMFTGREWDAESGTYYYRARQYHPTLGRFLQRDPVGYYDSMNLYGYVGNNPLNLIDPYGLWKFNLRNAFAEGGGAAVVSIVVTLAIAGEVVVPALAISTGVGFVYGGIKANFDKNQQFLIKASTKVIGKEPMEAATALAGHSAGFVFENMTCKEGEEISAADRIAQQTAKGTLEYSIYGGMTGSKFGWMGSVIGLSVGALGGAAKGLYQGMVETEVFNIKK